MAGVSTGSALRPLHRLVRRPEFGGIAAAIIVFVFFAIFADHGFLTRIGTANWVGTTAEFGIIALAVGLLMIGGEFDLSVGATTGLCSIVLGICAYAGISIGIGVALALATGILVGLLNGFLVTRTKLPSFIVTMAMMFVVAGLALGAARLFANSSTITVPQPDIVDPALPVVHAVLAGEIFGFRVVILWWLALAMLAGWVLRRTSFGNWILATGGNPASARGLGVRTDRVKIILFAIVGGAAGLVGVIQTMEYGTSAVDLGSSFIFIGIAACVIGGILLTGGYGTILGAVFGSITYGIITAGVQYLGWDSNLTQLFIGTFLLLAVLANNYLRTLAAGAGS